MISLGFHERTTNSLPDIVWFEITPILAKEFHFLKTLKNIFFSHAYSHLCVGVDLNDKSFLLMVPWRFIPFEFT